MSNQQLWLLIAISMLANAVMLLLVKRRMNDLLDDVIESLKRIEQKL